MKLYIDNKATNHKSYVCIVLEQYNYFKKGVVTYDVATDTWVVNIITINDDYLEKQHVLDCGPQYSHSYFDPYSLDYETINKRDDYVKLYKTLDKLHFYEKLNNEIKHKNEVKENKKVKI